MRKPTTAALLVLGLLVGACGSGNSATTASLFNPAVAQTQTTAPQRVQILATFANNAGAAEVLVDQNGRGLSGRGLVSRPGRTTPVRATGSLVENKVSLRLFPDDAVTGTDILSIRGELGGQGTWGDATDGASGQLRLQEVNGTPASIDIPGRELLGRLLDGQLTEGGRPEVFDIHCGTGGGEDGIRNYDFRVEFTGYSTVQKTFQGTWTSNRAIGEYAGYQATQGPAEALRYSPPLNTTGDIGLRLVKYNALGAGLVFRVPDDRNGSSSSLNQLDSLVWDAGDEVRVQGTLTVVSRGL